MIKPLAEPGQVVDLVRLEDGIQTPQIVRLVSTGNVQLTQVVVPKGGQIPTHAAQGEIVLHCLQGRTAVTTLGESHELRAGQLLYVCIGEPFSIRGVEDASLIITIIMPMQGTAVELFGD